MREFSKKQFKEWLFQQGYETFDGVDECSCAMTQFGQAMMGDIVHRSTTKGFLYDMDGHKIGWINISRDAIRYVVDSKTFREAYHNIEKGYNSSIR